MENKPTYRKTGIALGTVMVLQGMKPVSIIEFAVVGCITAIAIVAIVTQWNLDRSKEMKNEENKSSDRIDPAVGAD